MILMRNRLVLVALLLCLELAALGIAYQVLTSMECRATDAFGACRLLRSLAARALSVIAVFGLYVWARPQALRNLMGRIEAVPGDRRAALGLHLLGVVLMFLPLAMARGGDLGAIFALALGPWFAGAVAASAGALLWLAPAASWRDWLREEGYRPLPLLGLGLLLPELAELAYPLWDWPAIAAATFRSVCWVLRVFGAEPEIWPDAYTIGLDGFYVQVAQQCSGVEGFALVTGFALIYGFLFRGQVRFPHFWLVVIPLGIVLSWLLNVVRIAALIAIGAHVSPELAVNGFHSYAGWMFFTLLAMAMLWGVQATPWLQAAGAARPAPRLRLREDRTAAMIVPFVAFMLASLAAAALAPEPDLAYPVKVLAMVLALALFAPVYRGLVWSLDPVAIGVGAVVGLAWLATRQAPSEADLGLAAGLAGFGAASLALWAGFRLVGTVLLVPFVEELFFRGYLLGRLSRGGAGAQVVAIAVSSGFFALMHDRWLIAGAAGVAFALVLLRRGRLTDAALAHCVANLVVALWAVSRGDWGAI